MEGVPLAILYAVRVARLMVLWVALYLVDKVYQDAYVQYLARADDAAGTDGGDSDPDAETVKSGKSGKSGKDSDRARRSNGRVSDPPSLLPVIVFALGMEAVVMLVLVVALNAARYVHDPSGSNAYMIDGALLAALATDYALTTVLLLGVGLGVAATVQNVRLFRYREDGMRGIRALSTALLLCAAALFVAMPLQS